MKRQKLINKLTKNIKVLHLRSLPLKWVVISLVLLVTGSLLFHEQVGAFLGQKVKLPFVKNQTETVSNTPQPQEEVSNDKAIKSACVNKVRDYIESNKGKKTTKNEFVWQVNSKYRFCLAENGLTPEDLLSYPDESGSGFTGGGSNVQNAIEKSFEESEKYELERKQKCQQDWTKYNICLSEYNVKVLEYNSCMSDPRKSSSFCGPDEPYNTCSKPFCSF